MSFSDLGLLPELLRAVADKGYDSPSPIQIQAIPAVLSGRDVLANAQTGTGKTAGFVLPILQRLAADQANGTSRAPRALVLTPTRELAAQVAQSARDYGKYMQLRTYQVFGGVSINPQISTLRSGCDILVATPGRLLDLAQQRVADLSKVQVLVLDEADRMLDMGFINDIRKIIKLLPQKRQNLLFSATYSDDIRGLAERLLHDPLSIQVAPRNAPIELVEQRAYRVQKEQKRHLLVHLIQEGQWRQVLIFTRTKHGANRLTQQLEAAGMQARPSTATRAKPHESKRSTCSSADKSPHWWRRRSPRAASTSRSCRRWSTTNCPMCRKTTCTASAAPGAPVPPAKPCRWCRATSPACCATSSGFYAAAFRPCRRRYSRSSSRRRRPPRTAIAAGNAAPAIAPGNRPSQGQGRPGQHGGARSAPRTGGRRFRHEKLRPAAARALPLGALAPLRGAWAPARAGNWRNRRPSSDASGRIPRSPAGIRACCRSRSACLRTRRRTPVRAASGGRCRR